MSDAPNPQAELTRTAQVLRVIAVLCGAVHVVMFVWVVAARFLHSQGDHEWMAGAARDAVDRVRDGEPLYAEPSAQFISFLYTPIYFWLAGALAHVTSTFVASKVVSLVATGATMLAIARAARSLGASKYWAALAVFLHVGAYSVTLFFYDLERVDSTSAALVVVALAVLISKRGSTPSGAFVGGALFALSVFAKQANLLLLVAALVGLFAARSYRRAIFASAGAAIVGIPLYGWLQASTHGWFAYYCFRLPSQHGIETHFAATFFLTDAPKCFALTFASITFLVAIVRGFVRRSLPNEKDIVFGATLAASMVSAWLFRAHAGGYPNVILVWTPFACIAVALVATRAAASAENDAGKSSGSRIEIACLAGVACQLMAWFFDPGDVAPGPNDDRNAAQLAGIVHTLERQGETVLVTSGAVTTPRHFHSAALFDVLRAGDPPPKDYVASLATRRYAGLIFEAPNESPCAEPHCAELHELTMRNYFVAGRIPDPMFSTLVGFDARPRWILRPRQSHDGDNLDMKGLEQRERLEVALAVEHQLTRAPDPKEPLWDDSIESRAATFAHSPDANGTAGTPASPPH